MSWTKKCICDRCGKEITGTRYGAVVARKPEDALSDTLGITCESDYCEQCADEIKTFIMSTNVEESKVQDPKPVVVETAEVKENPAENILPVKENKTIYAPRRIGDKILPLIEAGLSTDEIVKLLGCTKQQVYAAKCYHAKHKQVPLPAVKAVNCDDVMKTCAYASREAGTVHTCDYLLRVGHSRGCPAEACTCYKHM